MKKLISKILPFQKYEIKTKISKQSILKKIDSVEDDNVMGETKYYSQIYENGFEISQGYFTSFIIGGARNSFAPVAVGEIEEKEDITVVSVKIRMRHSVSLFMMPLLIFSLLGFISSFVFLVVDIIGVLLGMGALTKFYSVGGFMFYPILQVVLFFGFNKPAKKLKEMLEDLIVF